MGQFESTGAKLGFLSCILGAAVLVWALAFACVAICPNYFVAGSQLKVAGYSKIIKACTEFEWFHWRPKEVTIANESINGQGALTVQNVLIGDVPRMRIRQGEGRTALYDLSDAKRNYVLISDWLVDGISRYLYGVLPEKRGGLSMILKFHPNIRKLDLSGKQAAFYIPPDSMHRERWKRYPARNISGFFGRDGGILGSNNGILQDSSLGSNLLQSAPHNVRLFQVHDYLSDDPAKLEKSAYRNDECQANVPPIGVLLFRHLLVPLPTMLHAAQRSSETINFVSASSAVHVHASPHPSAIFSSDTFFCFAPTNDQISSHWMRLQFTHLFK